MKKDVAVDTVSRIIRFLEQIKYSELNSEQMVMFEDCLPKLFVGIRNKTITPRILEQLRLGTYKFEVFDEVLKLRKASSKTVRLDLPPKAEDCGGSKLSIKHNNGGRPMKWNPSKVSLHLIKNQDNKHRLSVRDVYEVVKDLPCYNANMLDFLLKKENQHLIPQSWQGKEVFFWGTLYCCNDTIGNEILWVRYLECEDGIWQSDISAVDCDVTIRDMGSDDPAAVAV